MGQLDKKNAFIISIFFILIGIFFRFYQLNFENYWLDEMVFELFYLVPPSILTIEPFINLFSLDIIKLIKSIKSSGFPILSTDR